MLKKKYRLTKNKDFERLAKSKKNVFCPFFMLKFEPNSLNFSRFGIITSLKVSKKATLRNLIRRRINEILRLNLEKIKKGFDLVIIVSPQIIDKQGKVLKYREIEKNLKNILKKASLI